MKPCLAPVNNHVTLLPICYISTRDVALQTMAALRREPELGIKLLNGKLRGLWHTPSAASVISTVDFSILRAQLRFSAGRGENLARFSDIQLKLLPRG